MLYRKVRGHNGGGMQVLGSTMAKIKVIRAIIPKDEYFMIKEINKNKEILI
jgi:hypothetical protein